MEGEGKGEEEEEGEGGGVLGGESEVGVLGGVTQHGEGGVGPGLGGVDAR